jgi:hypothetical protein
MLRGEGSHGGHGGHGVAEYGTAMFRILEKQNCFRTSHFVLVLVVVLVLELELDFQGWRGRLRMAP